MPPDHHFAILVRQGLQRDLNLVPLLERFHTVGRGVGKDMRAKAGLPPLMVSGEGPAEGGSNLSDDALLAMARRRG